MPDDSTALRSHSSLTGSARAVPAASDVSDVGSVQGRTGQASLTEPALEWSGIGSIPSFAAIALFCATAVTCGDENSDGFSISWDGLLRMVGGSVFLGIALIAPLLLCTRVAARAFCFLVPSLYVCAMPFLAAAWRMDFDSAVELACEFSSDPRPTGMYGLAGYVSNARAMGGLCLCLAPALLLLARHAGMALGITGALLWLWLITSTAMAYDAHGNAWAERFDTIGSLAFLSSATVCFACTRPRHWPADVCLLLLGGCAVSVLMHAIAQQRMRYAASSSVLYCLQAVGLSSFTLLAVLGPAEPSPAAIYRPKDDALGGKATATHSGSSPAEDLRGARLVTPALPSSLASAQQLSRDHATALWPTTLPVLYFLCLPWLARIGFVPWPPPEPLGQAPSGVVTIAALIGTAPATAIAAALLVHVALVPSLPLLDPLEDATAMSPNPAASTIARLSIRSFWSLFGTALSLPISYQPVVHRAAETMMGIVAIAHLVSLLAATPPPPPPQYGAPHSVQMAFALVGVVALGLCAAAVSVAHGPLLSSPEGQTVSWARIGWPLSPADDHLLFLCQTLMLSAMLVAPPMSVRVTRARLSTQNCEMQRLGSLLL